MCSLLTVQSPLIADGNIGKIFWSFHFISFFSYHISFFTERIKFSLLFLLGDNNMGCLLTMPARLWMAFSLAHLTAVGTVTTMKVLKPMRLDLVCGWIIMQKMRKTVILIVFLVLGFLHLFPIQEKSQQTTDLTVELEFRAPHPGEAVKVQLKGREDIKLADIHFLGSKHTMGKGQNPATRMALVGLDLGIKPGTYKIDISVLFDDGSYENISKEIVVLGKEFPVKKLWVKQEYVTPPAEALERIRIESELLRQIYNIFTPDWLGEGNFIIPSEGKVAPNFGERRILNNQPRSSHGGVDISSPYGAPVRASNTGRVVLANDLYFAGKSVVIDHGLGVFTQYLHFSKIIAQRGELVKKGEVIGEIGATGRVTGPHLHWGVKISGARVDPLSLLNLEFD
jgi:hypothetical protein